MSGQGRVTTAEIIAAAGALGIGAMLGALLTHFLGRRQRAVNISGMQMQSASHSVQIMDTAMRRMETELARSLAALEKAEQDIEQLRSQLQQAVPLGEFPQIAEAVSNLALADAELTEARENMDNIAIILGDHHQNIYMPTDDAGRQTYARMTHQQRGALRDQNDAWFQQLMRKLDNNE